MIEIREVHAHELETAADVTVEGYRDFYRERLGSYVEQLRDVEARTRDGIVFVAVEDDEILGTVTYVPDPNSPYAQNQQDDEASIRMLSVTPKHMRRGVGRALSVWCIERARAEGKKSLSLHADDTMTASRRLYETLGFSRDPSRDYRPDAETNLICYVLELGGSATGRRTSHQSC